jgi:UDP-glucose 4-epimerase
LPRSRVLVTGGAGFIGSHLVDRLIEEKYEVTVLDNFFSGTIENLRKHLDTKRITLVTGDARNSADVRKAISGVSTIFHFTAIVDVQSSMKDPKLTNEVNVGGTLNVLKESLIENVESFIYISTCAVYGEAQYLPINEEHPIAPISPYGASKYEAENHCKTYNHTYGIKICCLRLFNVYGPRQSVGPYSGVITRFINDLEKGHPLTIYGDGKQTRDFIHVKDVVSACLLAMEKRHEACQAVNIGTGKPTSINELANILIKKSDQTDLKPIYRALREGDIRNSYADISKAQKMLSFKPKIGLEEGLESLVKHKFNFKPPRAH